MSDEICVGQIMIDDNWREDDHCFSERVTCFLNEMTQKVKKDYPSYKRCKVKLDKVDGIIRFFAVKKE